MSDFEQDFMSKVQTDGASAGGAVPGSVPVSAAAGKKSIDKRWFVIGGLVVVLAAVLIVMNMNGGLR